VGRTAPRVSETTRRRIIRLSLERVIAVETVDILALTASEIEMMTKRHMALLFPMGVNRGYQ
jgi:hypothetical protein